MVIWWKDNDFDDDFKLNCTKTIAYGSLEELSRHTTTDIDIEEKLPNEGEAELYISKLDERLDDQYVKGTRYSNGQIYRIIDEMNPELNSKFYGDTIKVKIRYSDLLDRPVAIQEVNGDNWYILAPLAVSDRNLWNLWSTWESSAMEVKA